MRPHGRFRPSRSKPEAQAVCDRCGFRYAHKELAWQFDWVGARLQNLRILVCQGCRDKPQENIRTIILPPDPTPVTNPRAEAFVSDDNPISGIGYSPLNLVDGRAGTNADSAFSGTLQGHGGPDAAFFGAAKLFSQSATLAPSSTAAAGNQITINWSQIPGLPTPPPVSVISSLPEQGYVIGTAVVSAPLDQPFLGGGASTTITLLGSNDGVTYTSLGTYTTLGAVGEVATITASPVSSAAAYGFHRITVAGDGVHAAAISSIQLNAVSASVAQTGSELGA